MWQNLKRTLDKNCFSYAAKVFFSKCGLKWDRKTFLNLSKLYTCLSQISSLKSMTVFAISWSLSLCLIHSSQKILTYLCTSDEIFECYNHITWYIIQWLERGTVNGERFFSLGFLGKEVMGFFWRCFQHIIENFWGSSILSSGGKRLHSTTGARTAPEQSSHVVVL